MAGSMHPMKIAKRTAAKTKEAEMFSRVSMQCSALPLALRPTEPAEVLLHAKCRHGSSL